MRHTALAQNALAQNALAQNALAQNALAQNALAQDALAQDALAQDALAQDALAQDALAQNTLAQNTLAKDTLAPDTLAPDTLAPDTLAPDTLAPDTLARLTRALLKLACVPLVLCSGCAAVAAGAGVVVVTDSFMDNAITVSVEEDVELVWPSVKATLANMTDALVHVNEDERLAETKIDNAVVTVYVKTNDVRETEIRITAKKIFIYNGEIATMVQRRIVKDVTR